MSRSDDILEKLKLNRKENIDKALAWPDVDFIEMEETYNKAKEIALDSKDSDAVAILEEKLSQLKEALSLKKQNQDANI